jgi:hypothetical protein
LSPRRWGCSCLHADLSSIDLLGLLSFSPTAEIPTISLFFLQHQPAATITSLLISVSLDCIKKPTCQSSRPFVPFSLGLYIRPPLFGPLPIGAPTTKVHEAAGPLVPPTARYLGRSSPPSTQPTILPMERRRVHDFALLCPSSHFSPLSLHCSSRTHTTSSLSLSLPPPPLSAFLPPARFLLRLQSWRYIWVHGLGGSGVTAASDLRKQTPFIVA